MDPDFRQDDAWMDSLCDRQNDRRIRPRRVGGEFDDIFGNLFGAIAALPAAGDVPSFAPRSRPRAG